MPLRMVWERSLDIIKVTETPRTIIAVSKSAENAELAIPPFVPVKNKEIMIKRKGNRPLQGTKTLVKIAMSLSRGLSIIRVPMIPQALQPKPIAMCSKPPYALTSHTVVNHAGR